MTRSKLIYTVAATAMLSPAALLADTPQASTGTGSEVASETPFVYDTNSPRINNGMAEFDDTSIAMPNAVFKALANARGEELETNDGTVIGMIERVNTNAQGNPELVVDVESEAIIPADTLIVTVQPGNVMLGNEGIYLTTSVAELKLKAEKNSVRDSEDRVSVTLF
jgi:hypothetical protein